MHVVPVGLRFGVAPFLPRSADEAVLESADCARADAFTFRRKTARVKAMELNVESSSHDNGIGGRSRRLPSALEAMEG